MLRNKNFIPLSHQHQHALALCVRLDRALQAGAVEADVWQAEIQQIFEQEIAVHFAAEEKEVFPTAARFLELQPLIDELLAEHGVLRGLFAQAASRTLAAQGRQDLWAGFRDHTAGKKGGCLRGWRRRIPGGGWPGPGGRWEG